MSKIEWTDTTWNPLAGCTWASSGCDRCYAAVMARRLGFMAEADIAAGRSPGKKRKYIGITNKNSAGRIMFNGVVNLDRAALSEPFGWTKPRRVFVNSMSDLFHKDVPDAFVDQVFATMMLSPQHTYQVLTKRPERMAAYLRWDGHNQELAQRNQNCDCRQCSIVRAGVAILPKKDYGPGTMGLALYLYEHWPLPNIWCGTSVENQEQADARIPHLMNVPARVRFLSCEPLLGPLDLSDVAISSGETYGLRDGLIHWIITGAESGHGARPMDERWVRSLRDQCQDAGVAFFYKQDARQGHKIPTPELDGRQWVEMPS